MPEDRPRRTVSINDIEFSIGPCRHCGGLASEAEALRALSDWSESFGERPSCAVCGEPIKMSKVVLQHLTIGRDRRETIWKVAHVILPNCLSFTGFNGTHVRIHGSCAREGLPFADWRSLDGETVEQGRGRMPWDDVVGICERPHGT